MLTFSESQTLISVNARLFKAISLPPISQQLGPVTYSPPNSKVSKLINRVGAVVEAKDRGQLKLLTAITSQITSHFALQARLDNAPPSRKASKWTPSQE